MACLKYVLLFVRSACVFYHLTTTEGIRIEQGPTNVTLNIGGSETLICDVTDQSVNTILWYHVSKHIFISEGSKLYNNNELPKNYNIRVDEGIRSFNLEITDAEMGNSGWYECGYLNTLKVYKSLGSPAYVSVRGSQRPPEAILAPPVCRVTQLPRQRDKDLEIDVVCIWNDERSTIHPSLFYHGAPVESNVSFGNRIISRIISPSQGVNGFVCGLLLENSTVVINSTCDVISNQIARIRMDPLMNDVYEGNVANFSCSIDDHGRNPIDILITKDGKDLGRSTSVDTLQVQFTPVLQDNNTVVECIASDLPGTMIRVESFLRILPAITTTIDTRTTTMTNATAQSTVTPTFASSMKTMTLFIIVIIIASVVTILFCILAVVGVYARRKRRKDALNPATYKSEAPVELVETTMILDETDELVLKKSTDDVSAYAVSMPSTPEISSLLPPYTTSSTPARRSSLPDKIFHYQDLEDCITTRGFRDRKQSEPFVVYGKPLEMNLRKCTSQGVTTSIAAEASGSVNEPDAVSVIYAKPDKPKIRKWASQGAGAFERNSSSDKSRDLFYRKTSEPGPLYAMPDKSTTSLDASPVKFPHYAKPNKKRDRRYLSQKVGKSSVPTHKTRKWMSMSKERVGIDSFPKKSLYSEIEGLSQSEDDDTIQYAESSDISRQSTTQSNPIVPSIQSSSLPLYADPDDFTSSASLKHGGYDKIGIIQSSLINEVKERLLKSPHYESVHREKDPTKDTESDMFSTTTDTVDESLTTSEYETEAEGTTESNTGFFDDSFEILEKNSLDILLTDDDDSETVNDSEGETEMMVNPHYQMSRLKQIL